MASTHASRFSDAQQSLELVHARIMHMFPELVRELGGDPNTLIAEVTGSATEPSAAVPTLTLRQGLQVLELAATRLGCEDFGMRLAVRQYGGKIFGPVGSAMASCSNYGEALRFAQTHSYAHSLVVSMWSETLNHEQAVFAGHEITLDQLPDKRQFLEQTLLSGNIAAKLLTDGKTKARRAHMRHEAISPMRVYHRYFGCDVYFDQPSYGLVFAQRDLLHPITSSDHTQLSAAIDYIEKHFDVRHPPLHTKVRGTIMRRLGIDDCSNDAVAEELNMHSRTLHRHLKALGTSFQEIKDDVRKDLLLYFLHKTDLDLLKVSERLDFAEQSVMTRYCRRWFAASPRALRQQGQPAHSSHAG